MIIFVETKIKIMILQENEYKAILNGITAINVKFDDGYFAEDDYEIDIQDYKVQFDLTVEETEDRNGTAQLDITVEDIRVFDQFSDIYDKEAIPCDWKDQLMDKIIASINI